MMVMVLVSPQTMLTRRGAAKRGTLSRKKASIIWSVALLMERHGMTRSKACEDINITSGMHWAWKKSIDALLEAKKNNIKAKSSHSGRDLCLTQHKQEQGMAVTVSMVVTKASQLSDEFQGKSKHARYHSA
jgi:hypothetical protein